jgi:hypothetical protein
MAMMMTWMVASTAERRNDSGIFCFYLGWTTIGTDSFQKEYETLVAMINISTDRTNTNSPAA